jgi:protein gp37
MADHSTIEWTDATWNPITGCSVTSPGCKRCYAMKLAGTRLQHHPSRAGLTQETDAGPVWTGEVRFNEEWLRQPLNWRRARMIFVCAHGDLFHESVPDEWIDRIFAVMALAEQHTFQVLTKRAERMRAYFANPVREALIGQQIVRLQLERDGSPYAIWSGLPLWNVWLGVSVEDQKRADERVALLLQVPARIRYLSMEPLLEAVSFVGMFANPSDMRDGTNVLEKIDWVIVGGESGAGARPMHPEWARSLRDQCEATGVPFFFKQWGEWIAYEHSAQPPFLWSQHGHEIDGHTLPDFESGDYDASRSEWHMDWAEMLLARRVGKKAAGRQLDGREWNGMPR